jgi:hypothetical protein
MHFVQVNGQVFLNFLEAVGRFSLFFSGVVSAGVRRPFYFSQTLRQVLEIGFFVCRNWDRKNLNASRERMMTYF